MKNWIKSGAPWIWLTSSAITISLLAVLVVLLLIGWKGLNHFWVKPIQQWSTLNGSIVAGQIYQTNNLSPAQASKSAPIAIQRLTVKIGNREVNQADFIALDTNHIKSEGFPEDLVLLKRRNNGDFIGRVMQIEMSEGIVTRHLEPLLFNEIDRAESVRSEISDLIDSSVRPNSWQLEELESTLDRQTTLSSLSKLENKETLNAIKYLKQNLGNAEVRLQKLNGSLDTTRVYIQDMSGGITAIPLTDILDAWYPNKMSLTDKWIHWLKQLMLFLSDDPREANSEGGVFPAIFGTILLVLIMSVIVMPLGIVGAVYLHEYASDNRLTKTIRIAVVNLAGVPSIVYGVFGLGFFVYSIGGSIDQLFYSEQLPAPTFGTPGLLWSALTMALMTLPVVIVATEEGLARIPQSIRDGSLALGATQFETIWRLVLPMARPALLTGLILAVARAAGEVAPLMLVGVAKLAPTLPIDGQFPYLHLERNFMHLGFHIYDVGFQTSNIEAARPLVYATSFLLVTVIIGLNLTAIRFRNSLRERYKSFEAS